MTVSRKSILDAMFTRLKPAWGVDDRILAGPDHGAPVNHRTERDVAMAGSSGGRRRGSAPGARAGRAIRCATASLLSVTTSSSKTITYALGNSGAVPPGGAEGEQTKPKAEY